MVISLLHNEIAHVVKSPSGSEQDEVSPSSEVRTVWAKGDAWKISRLDSWETANVDVSKGVQESDAISPCSVISKMKCELGRDVAQLVEILPRMQEVLGLPSCWISQAWWCVPVMLAFGR